MYKGQRCRKNETVFPKHQIQPECIMKFESFVTVAAWLLAWSALSAELLEPPWDYKWFVQSKDHFGADNGTFKQSYSILDQHFKPGGPILYFVGEETTSWTV